MPTDNFPVEFRYISKRLTTDLVKQWVAGKSQVRVESSVLLGPTRLTIKVSDIDYDNPYLLAKLATAAVADSTGWIDAQDPLRRIPTGRYIRARMFLQFNELQVSGWEDGGDHRVAVFAGWETLPDFGSVFVGLVGSQANVIGVQGEPRSTVSGRTASDVRGLYDLIKTTRSASEAMPSSYQLEREAALEGADAVIAAAADSFRASDLRGPSRMLDALFVVHEDRHGDLLFEDLDLGLTGADGEPLPPFNCAVIGAPIWVATVPPDAQRSSLFQVGLRQQSNALLAARSHREIPVARAAETGLRNLRLSMGQDSPTESDLRSVSVSLPQENVLVRERLFEEWVSAYVGVWHGLEPQAQLEEWPLDDDGWSEYRVWAVETALRTANRPWPFVRKVSVRNGVFKRRQTAWRQLGEAGWSTVAPVRTAGRRLGSVSQQFMLLTTGEVVATSGHGWEDDRDEVDRNVAAQAILRTAARWRTPFGPDHWEDPDFTLSGSISRRAHQF